MKKTLIPLAAVALASCAPKKAIVIEEPKKSSAQEKSVADIAPAEKPASDDGGMRLPDMLALPDENQLRSAAPSDKSGDATIIATPPAE